MKMQIDIDSNRVQCCCRCCYCIILMWCYSAKWRAASQLIIDMQMKRRLAASDKHADEVTFLSHPAHVMPRADDDLFLISSSSMCISWANRKLRRASGNCWQGSDLVKIISGIVEEVTQLPHTQLTEKSTRRSQLNVVNFAALAIKVSSSVRKVSTEQTSAMRNSYWNQIDIHHIDRRDLKLCD